MTATRMTPNGAAPVAPRCPTCGGAMYDNRGDKTSPAAPDFRCKNPRCVDDDGRRTAVWEHDRVRAVAPTNRNGNGARKPAPNGHAPAASTPVEFQHIAHVHYRCLSFVLAHELPKLEALGGDVIGAVSALTAQLFIECNGRGALR